MASFYTQARIYQWDVVLVEGCTAYVHLLYVPFGFDSESRELHQPVWDSKIARGRNRK